MRSSRIYDAILKRPVLMIGILMMIIFLYQLYDSQYAERFNTEPCRSAIVGVKNHVKTNTKLKCSNHNLVLEEKIAFKEAPKTRAEALRIGYTTLANGLMFVATNADNDSLEHTPYVVYRVTSKYVDIGSRIEGKHLAKFASLAITKKDEQDEVALLNKRKIIAEHLHAHAEVQETWKVDLK